MNKHELKHRGDKVDIIEDKSGLAHSIEGHVQAFINSGGVITQCDIDETAMPGGLTYITPSFWFDA